MEMPVGRRSGKRNTASAVGMEKTNEIKMPKRAITHRVKKSKGLEKGNVGRKQKQKYQVAQG